MSRTNPTYVDGERVEGAWRCSAGRRSGSPTASRCGSRSAIRASASRAARGPAVAARGHGGEAAPRCRDRARVRLQWLVPRPRRGRLPRDEGRGEATRTHHRVVRALPQLRDARVQEHEGQVLNSNGDELMCFFDEPVQAVRAAAALLASSSNSTRARICSGARSACARASTPARRWSIAGAEWLTAPCSTSRGISRSTRPSMACSSQPTRSRVCPTRCASHAAGEVGRELVAAHRFESIAQTATPPEEE